MFVWIFHRASGLLLIIFLGVQLSTGFFQASSSNSELVKTVADLHRHAGLNCFMVLLVIFHALYGLRTILIDLGVRREKMLFWTANVLGTGLYALFLMLYFSFVKP